MKKIFWNTILLAFLLFFANNSFSQTYTDKEIGFNEARLIQKLISKDVKQEDIVYIINTERDLYVKAYQAMLLEMQSFENQLPFQMQSMAMSSAASVSCSVDSVQRSILIDLYNATDGANWINNTNWNTTADVCDWYGVSVNATKDTIIGISLNYNNLQGTIPASLGGLTNLKDLWLQNNNLSGHIPSELGNTSLETLYLFNNTLDSIMPASLGDLTNLKRLWLQDNNLSGNIPSELGNTSLETLYINNNHLDSIIPVSLGNLMNLKTLSLHSNDLSGHIPSELGYTSLETLYLFNNNLDGEIPVSLENLTNLKVLWLQTNNLTGTIPSGLSTSLEGLYLNTNNLVSVIPTSLGALTNLRYLSLHHNNLSGPIPSELGNTSLETLFLDSNNLEGGIPSSLGGLTNLRHLSLHSNNLSGHVPSELGNTSLETLFLYDNELEGVIPTSLSSLEALYHLHFQANRFVFGDFENEHPNYATNVTSYHYSPQAKVDEEETINLTEGDTYTLTTSLNSVNNHYQWRKSTDGGSTWAVVGSDSNTYVINSATAADAGMYRFNATNDIITGLTLERNVITVNVNPSIICLSGSSYVTSIGWTDNDLTLGMIDGSTISSVSATIISGFDASGEVSLNQSFDAQGHLSFGGSAYYAYSTFKIDYTINSSTGSYQGTQMVYSGSHNLEDLPASNNITFQCPIIAIDNDNTFCLSDYEEYPIVENLFPRGDNIQWYATETGGEPFNNDDELLEEAEDIGGTTFWWDDTTDGNSNRIAATVIIYDVPEGDTEQIFSIYASPAPTILDIEVENGDDTVYWYDSESSTTTLNSNTILIDGQTYYASSCDSSDIDCSCRLPVTITIGIIPPKGDFVQYLCEESTLNDLVIEVDNNNLLLWYDAEIGGNVLTESTLLTEGNTYYVSQKDNNTNQESQERLAVLVYTISVDTPIVPENPQHFYANESQTVGDLIAYGQNIKWYSQADGGSEYSDATALENGTIYYAEQVSGTCPSTERIAVTVDLDPLEADPLLGCELFRPELLGHYVIDAWVNEREVETDTISGTLFNGSDERVLFVGLLNHLKNRLLSEDKDLHDFPIEYEPEFTGGESELDFAPLMTYIEGLQASEKKFIVYDFKPINDSYGRTIGFSFYLNEARTKQIAYKSPKIVRNGVEESERYPLLDNNIGNATDEFLNFTSVEVDNSGQLILYADFNQTLPPSHSESQEVTRSELDLITDTNLNADANLNVIKSTSTYYKYTEVPYQAVSTYNQAKIEISFIDADGQSIGNPIVFSPRGEIIDKWQKITGDFTIPGDAGRMTISLKNNDTSKIVYFDDLRIQPFDSNMKTFVYHPENQRLMSELDKNNYATFYEYDLEGGLVRVKKETVKGVYTIQETRSGNVKATN